MTGTRSRGTLIFLVAFSLLLGASERTSRAGSDSTLSEKIKLGESSREIGNFKKAIDIFKSALEQAEATGAREEALGCLKQLALLNWNIGENEEASAFYSKALKIALQTNHQDLQLEFQTALAIGRFYAKGREDYFSGQYNRSIQNFNEALGLARNIKSCEHQVKCLRMLSADYWCLDKFQEFFALNEEGLKLAKEVNNKEEEGKCLNNIALYYLKTGELSNTLRYLEESLWIAKKLGDKKTEGYCLNNLGIVFKDLGNYEKALNSLRNRWKSTRTLADDRNIAKDLNNLGSVYWRKGRIILEQSDISRAINNYNESLRIVKKI